MAKEAFDPACASPITAVKAIFLLWRRGRWALLQRVFPAIPRERLDLIFTIFDEVFVEGERGIRTEEQVFELVRMFPPMAEAAVLMVGVYQMRFREVA